MKKKIAVLAAALCALMLVFCAAGCAGSGGKGQMVGTWEIAAIEGQGAISAEELEATKASGRTVSLTLNEDGSASLDYLGTKSPGQWTASSDNQGSLTTTGKGSAEFTISDGRLVMQDNGTTLVFVKK